ncbi:MAG: STAS/SEC14 domain-containing protein [Colwellia sp.]|nr:STAS/SEC14 domain-containing protein [Colwellia sp.]MCW8864459.1 STAS/SEC14 domain-containing protein [Colwellia sp.]MCW9081449.1 STAS/SEC14 domain-containing protein [Colwellia sp.]
MELHEISFGKIIVLRDDIAEVIVDEGVNIDTDMVTEIHTCLLSIFANSFSLLINKSNSYSTQLDALIQFGELPAIDKIAVFAPNKMAKLSADFAADIPSSADLNIQVFTDRDEAFAWLI